jgi:hypothetical protein
MRFEPHITNRESLATYHLPLASAFAAHAAVLDCAQQEFEKKFSSLPVRGTSGSVQRFPVNPARPGREQR